MKSDSKSTEELRASAYDFVHDIISWRHDEDDAIERLLQLFDQELAKRVEEATIKAQIKESRMYLVFREIKPHVQQRIDELEHELVALDNQTKEEK